MVLSGVVFQGSIQARLRTHRDPGVGWREGWGQEFGDLIETRMQRAQFGLWKQGTDSVVFQT